MNEDEITKGVTELRRKIDNFRKKVDLRTNLLFIASNFFLHFDEIIAWFKIKLFLKKKKCLIVKNIYRYDKMDHRLQSIALVPDSVEECELNKEKLQSENDGTLQVAHLNFFKKIK